MASATLVEDVARIVKELRQQRGEFRLAMLYSNYEGGNGDWNFIVSAPWAERLGTADSIQLIAQALHRGLREENKTQISRITVLDANDPFVLEITSLVKVAGVASQKYISNSIFGGVHVPRGIIFYSQRPFRPAPTVQR